MARLVARSAHWFSLTPASYQFVDLRTQWNDDDANWLVVRLEAMLGGREWSAVDPALQTWDIAALASWCDAMAAGTLMAGNWWSGLEPNIRLEAGEASGGVRTLFVELAHQFGPPALPIDQELREQMDVERTALESVAGDLRSELRPFPVRRVRAGRLSRPAARLRGMAVSVACGSRCSP